MPLPPSIRSPRRAAGPHWWALCAMLLCLGCNSSAAPVIPGTTSAAGQAAQQVEQPGLSPQDPEANRSQFNDLPVSVPEDLLPAGQQGQFVLSDVAARAGVAFTYQNDKEAGNYTIVESLGGGVGMFDYDGDGSLDLFYPGGGWYEGQVLRGRPSGMFRNLGDWRFESVAGPAGVAPAFTFTHGCACGDYDSDGFTDVLVTGYGGVTLWHNQGDGTFLEATRQVGISDTLWSSSAGWGDLNGDGHLDLYVVHYTNWSFDFNPYCRGPKEDLREICSPKEFEPLPDAVYYSRGDGTFRDASVEAGLRLDGKGLGVILGDLDNDRDLDIYVANDTTENFLYLNNGHGVFSEEGLLQGVALDDFGVPNGSMGLELFDGNLDGFLDIWVANFEREACAVYRNDAGRGFTHISQQTGITGLGGLFVSWGSACIDMDRDGDEDIVVINGHAILWSATAPYRQLPFLLVNHDRGHQYERAKFPVDSHFGTPHQGRGLAAGDLDGDGDIDFAVSHLNEPVAVLKNDSPDPNGYLLVKLVGRSSNRDAVGARLVLHTSAGDQTRQVDGGGSYESASDRRPFWGIPRSARVTGLTVYWPSGIVQDVSPLGTDQALTLIEPDPPSAGTH